MPPLNKEGNSNSTPGKKRSRLDSNKFLLTVEFVIVVLSLCVYEKLFMHVRTPECVVDFIFVDYRLF